MRSRDVQEIQLGEVRCRRFSEVQGGAGDSVRFRGLQEIQLSGVRCRIFSDVQGGAGDIVRWGVISCDEVQ